MTDLTGRALDAEIAENKDIIKGLRYIASSPPREHGGFHPTAVQTAKDAIELIDKLRAVAEAARAYCRAMDYAEGNHYTTGTALKESLEKAGMPLFEKTEANQ